jgi:hypothetical protein
VFAKRITDDGTVLPWSPSAGTVFPGNELQVNTLTNGTQFGVSVASAGQDGFLIAWWSGTGPDLNSTSAFFVKWFDVDGNPVPQGFVDVDGPCYIDQPVVAPCYPGSMLSVAQNDYGCVPCAGGSFAQFDGSTQCLPCPAGKFQPSSGGAICYQCRISTNSTTSCIDTMVIVQMLDATDLINTTHHIVDIGLGAPPVVSLNANISLANNTLDVYVPISNATVGTTLTVLTFNKTQPNVNVTSPYGAVDVTLVNAAMGNDTSCPPLINVAQTSNDTAFSVSLSFEADPSCLTTPTNVGLIVGMACLGVGLICCYIVAGVLLRYRRRQNRATHEAPSVYGSVRGSEFGTGLKEESDTNARSRGER